MADICQFVCAYRTPSGYCGSTGGYATCQHRKMDEPPTIISAEPVKPMTNADKYIRNATDEELADVLSGGCPWTVDGGTPSKFREYLADENGSCMQCWLDWLKQEVCDE